MPLPVLTGTRLRERRLALGLKQAVVAERAGISASYLNLIEHNRRAVGETLLERLGQALGLERSSFVPGSDAALFEGLRSAVARTETGEDDAQTEVELDRLGDFVSRFPGWASLVVALDRRAETLERALAALNDRMTHDPHLSKSLHELLSALASVRSTAAILAETRDLGPEWSDRFHRNLFKDSERLVQGAEALVAYLDTGSSTPEDGIATPQDEVEDWLRLWVWNAAGEARDPATLRGQIDTLASHAARHLAAAYVEEAERDAAIVPLAALREALALLGPDPFALAGHLACDPMVVMRRLASLPELGLGLVICDASGTFTFRKPAFGFPLPRFGAACPLWPLYRALGHVRFPVETRVELAGQGGGRHRVFAWAVSDLPEGPRGPELRRAAMLILPAEPPAAQDLALSLIPVGSSCRVCPRKACRARRELSILAGQG